MHERKLDPLAAEHPLSCLGPHDHPCLIYDTPEEQADSYVPYLHAGLLQGEYCVYVVDETHPEFIRTAFRAREVDVDSYEESGAFKIISKHDAYLIGGYFDTEKMMKFWEATVADALSSGYTAVRAAAEMTWSLGDEPGNDQLVAYESALNEIFPKLKVSALCQYDRKRFPANVIKDMIHVHPLVSFAENTYTNAGFIPHQQFIENHDDMEVQAFMDNIALANKLQQKNDELNAALEKSKQQQVAIAEFVRLQDELKKALQSEKKTREYAEDLRGELQDFVDNATEGLHWVGPDGTIIWANRAELDLLGYSESEYVGKNIREFYAEPAEIEQLLTRLTNQETVRNYQGRLRCKDGSIKTVLINSNVLWRDGKFVHTQCFTRDITELIHAQNQVAETEQTRELNDELHRLARSVSHELQEPVSKIRSYLSLLSVRYKGQLGSDADEFIEICSRSAKVVHRMVDDLWLFARMTRVDESDLSEVASDVVVASVVEPYRERIKAIQGEVVLGDLPRLRHSEKQLYFLFDSIISNAIAHQRDGVPLQVQIGSTHSKGMWKIWISDNGIGIDPMNFRDIFRAFYRVNARPGDKRTGMGLAICQQIVRSRGGEIWVESKAGQGATFFFTVPDELNEARRTTHDDRHSHNIR